MTKEEIKDLYSMKDILERYGLQKPNRAGFICCPFHKEKTASMKIYKRDFNCFGCGANGDIFTFVMLMDIYRKWIDRLEPLSDAWADTYNALQYQEYLWEILNDPEECYEAIK